MSEKENNGVSFSSADIPEEMRESMVSSAFSGAVELHDLIRNMGATVDQAGFTLGLAGNMFIASLKDERKGSFDKMTLAVFLGQMIEGLWADASCDIEHINAVLDDIGQDNNALAATAAEVFLNVVEDVPPVDVSALSDEQRDSIGREVGVMAMEDFNGAIKGGGLGVQEVAFMYGLAARILIDVTVNMKLHQKGDTDLLVRKMLAGFAQGMAQQVGVSVDTYSAVNDMKPATVH